MMTPADQDLFCFCPAIVTRAAVDGTSSQIPAFVFTLVLYLGVKVTQNVGQYPLHHVSYVPVKFEVATSSDLGDVFIRKYIS